MLFGYALARPDRLRRGAVYGVAAAVGAAPALLYNLWSLGSPLRFAYSHAVAVQGRSGHEELGLNSAGFFGITRPRPDAALELLMSGRGLLTLTPVLVMGVVGAVLMWRRGHRAEAGVIGAVTAVYFLYNAGYWQPMAAGLPARVLDPGAPLPGARPGARLPAVQATTLGLAIPSGLRWWPRRSPTRCWAMHSTGIWVTGSARGSSSTPCSRRGGHEPWLAVLPVLAAIAAAVSFAAGATPAPTAHRAPGALRRTGAHGRRGRGSQPRRRLCPAARRRLRARPGRMAAATAALVLLVLRRREARGERAPERTLVLEPPRIS